MDHNTSQLPGFLQSFHSHPASVGESYFGHMAFAATCAARLFLAGGAALVHAVVPAWFESTASRQITAMYNDMTRRHGVPEKTQSDHV